MSKVLTGERKDTAANTPFGDWSHVSLSPRQRQILTLLRAGKSNKEIATDLNIGLGTTKQHLVTLFKKLGVTNRAMAISKSHALSGISIDGPVAIKDPTQDQSVNMAYSERRPVAVLCLQPNTVGMVLSDDTTKYLNRLYSDVAFDFGAGFLIHSGGRCDLIFGIRQVRRHDILRAVRAAVSISESYTGSLDAGFKLQAGLAYGYIVASMNSDGEWTGEAIHGAVISTAQREMNHASAGCLNLHHTAKRMIEHIGFDVAHTTGNEIALSPDHRWRPKQDLRQSKLAGRASELEVLRGALQKHLNGQSTLISIEGETGMGKTALARAFGEQAGAAGLGLDYWACSLADSQPGTPSRGWLEHSDGKQFNDLDGFCKSVLGGGSRRSNPLIIENCHNLQKPKFQALLDHIHKNCQNQLVVLTHRGGLPFLEPALENLTKLRLQRLSDSEMGAVLSNLLGPAHKAEKWIKQMAFGVPLFLRQLADFAFGEIENERDRPGVIPPIELYAVVCERVESHKLDRRLLHVIAHLKRPEPLNVICKSWPGDIEELEVKIDRAIQAGVLEAVKGNRRSATQYRISHPLLDWVFSVLFLSSDTSFS